MFKVRERVEKRDRKMEPLYLRVKWFLYRPKILIDYMTFDPSRLTSTHLQNEVKDCKRRSNSKNISYQEPYYDYIC